jgi:hypothetical protein
LPSTPRSPAERKIFHIEGCSCPPVWKDKLLLASSTPQLYIPGRSDYQGVEVRRAWAEDRRFYANQILREVNQEFNRLFADAQVQSTHCSVSQELWTVFHYCNLPYNSSRTNHGRSVGELLHHAAYDALNHDCLRFFQPCVVNRGIRCALRIIPRIIEHCVFKSRHLGPRGIARLVPGTWGFSIPNNWTILQYVTQRHQFPRTARLNFRINKFVASEYCVAGPLPEVCHCPVQLTLRPFTLWPLEEDPDSSDSSSPSPESDPESSAGNSPWSPQGWSDVAVSPLSPSHAGGSTLNYPPV